MIEEVAPALYRVEVPIPRNPLKSLNSYFIKGQDRNLIIDTGMNLPECKEALLNAIGQLEFDLYKTDFYITHLHVDHLELVPHLAKPTSKIYLNSKEANMLSNPTGWEAFRSFYLKYGLPEDELQKMEQNHMTQGYQSGGFRLNFLNLHENEILRAGDYVFRCIDTPGHSPGHTCLYESEKKILVSGDHVLFDITPNITGWPIMENSLGEYLKSLDKINNLDVALVLPGHRSIQKNHLKRVQELKKHHRARANEIYTALDKVGKTAFQVAPRVTWDVTYASWEQFPTPQKFFAFGEVIAHLRYLEGEGSILREWKNGQIVFYRNN